MRLLVLRTSAMGDVALITPVIKGFEEQYKGVQILLVTRKAFGSFFRSTGNVLLFFPNFRGRHKGFLGIFRLYRDIKKEGKVDYVIDLHNVIRTKILRFLFRVTGTKVRVIDKGRKEKRSLIKGKKIGQLKHSVERYAEVFERAGYKIELSAGPWIVPSGKAVVNSGKIAGISGGLNVGVAPYARHNLKMWPEEYMIALLKMIFEKHGARFWLFGGSDEVEKLSCFQEKVPGSFLITGKLNLDEELALMTRLSYMISMDSSNMHMAALTGTKVVSIWGGTDPVTGFGAWMQPAEHFISIPVDQLSCRPCTVYGKGKCRRGDHACMKWLTPEVVYEKIVNLDILK
jgi:ADP-heptose:LPS heptosyltransferase